MYHITYSQDGDGQKLDVAIRKNRVTLSIIQLKEGEQPSLTAEICIDSSEILELADIIKMKNGRG